MEKETAVVVVSASTYELDITGILPQGSPTNTYPGDLPAGLHRFHFRMHRESTCTPSNVLLLDNLDDLRCFRPNRFDHSHCTVCLHSILMVQAVQELRSSIVKKC